MSQRRRLAALALLAQSRRQALGREKLVTMLWPESESDRARHLLSDTVYVINRALGGEVITAAADELRLQGDRLVCDAREFEGSVESGAFAEAVRLYAGPFLDGFFLDGSEEFARWASAERERLSALFASALEGLAAERAASGDDRGAVECWRRLAAEDPYNSRVVCGLALALDRAGDRAGALQQAEIHVSTLKKELGVSAPGEIAALIHTLRAAPAAPASAVPPDPPAPAAIERTTVAARAIAEPAEVAIASEGDVAWRSLELPTGPTRRVMFISAALAIVLLVAGVGLFWPRSTSSVTATTLQSIAVLPFADLSPSRDHDYFSDGIAEELSTRLSRVAGLKVAARTSAFAFRDTDADARAIGRALNVDALLEGSVRQVEGRVRIAVRLVDARAGYQLWADSWDRAGHDVLAVQDEIARSVVRVLRGGGTAHMAAAGGARAIDPAAFDLYLKGRYFWHQRTRDSLTQAAAAFERAVALAPGYAEAYSGLADAYGVLGFYDYLPPRDAFPRAKTAAQTALRLDDGLAEAYASLGYVALYYDWNWPEAERAFERAIELNPSYSIAHQWFANYLVARGRFAEAVSTMRRAHEVDPLSLIASAALGWVHYYRRDFDAASEQCQRTIELNPRFELAWLWGGSANESAGRYGEARDMLQQAVTLSGRSAIALAALGRAQALAGDRTAAGTTLAELQQNHARYLPAYEMAKLLLAMGGRREALGWLRKAYEQRSHSMVFLAVDPQLDSLRADADFRALLVETGVGEP